MIPDGIQEEFLAAEASQSFTRNLQAWLSGESPGAPQALVDKVVDCPALLETLSPSTLGKLVKAVGIEECAGLLLVLSESQTRALADDVLWKTALGTTAFDADALADWLQGMEHLEPEERVGIAMKLGEEYMAGFIAEFARVVEMLDVLVDARVSGPFAECWPPFESAFGRHVVLVKDDAETWRSELLTWLQDLHEHEPAFLEHVLQRCTETLFDLDGAGSHMAHEQVVGDLAEERVSRRRAMGFLTPEDAAALLRELRTSDDALRLWRLLERFRRVRPAPCRIVTWDDEKCLPATADESPFRRKLADLCSASARLEEGFRDDLAVLANVVAQGAHLGSRAMDVRLAPEAVLACCELGASEVRSAGAEFVVACFRTGWQRMRDEMVLPVARALDEVLSQKRPELRLLRECWMQTVLERGGKAPSFVRLCRTGEFLTASLLVEEISAVMPGTTAMSLCHFISEFPALLPGPRFPASPIQLQAAVAFAARLETLV